MNEHVMFALAVGALVAVTVLVLRRLSRKADTAHVEGGRTGQVSGSYQGLSGADLSGTDLKSLERRFGSLGGKTGDGLKHADLRGANLSDAHLTAAQMQGAFLQRANLTKATLIQADLRDTDLRGADLTGASLLGANLTGARYNDATTFPAGFNPEERGMIRVARMEITDDHLAVPGPTEG